MEFKMTVDHVTKGAVCYKDDANHSIYLRKEELNGKIPEAITVTVKL
jgi:hypothetical protein